MPAPDKINDIIEPTEGNKNIVVDLTQFFEKSILKAIKLNQQNLFSDIYLELKEKIDLSKKKILKIKLFSNDDFRDVSKIEVPKNPLTQMLSKKKKRYLANPIMLIEPLIYKIRNSLDIRVLEIIPAEKTYPDIYALPLLPKQKIKKFYKNNHETIKK
jgi:hypothetical protein